jgi:hypothetical protein
MEATRQSISPDPERRRVQARLFLSMYGLTDHAAREMASEFASYLDKLARESGGELRQLEISAPLVEKWLDEN